MHVYTEYTMDFIRAQPGAYRNIDDGDCSLANFGYEACQSIQSIPIPARNVSEAREQAQRHWQAWLRRPYPTEPDGYWITDPIGRIKHIFIEDPQAGDRRHGRFG
jgi:hypothetical protein